MRDFGVGKGGVVYADSSAALAIAKLKGAGKLNHINVNCQSAQDIQGTRQLELRKVLGAEKPPDMMTKNLAGQSLDKCMAHLNQPRAGGRAKAGLDVQDGGRAEGNPGSDPSVLPGAAASNVKRQSPSPTQDIAGTRLSSIVTCGLEPANAPYR